MASRLERLVMIEKRIRAGTYPTVDELCRMFEVKRRTLYLDIRELRERLGLDIRFDKGRGGYYLANPHRELPEFNLTDDEYITLVIGQRVLCHFGGPSFESLSFSALQKIASFSPLIEPDVDLPQLAFATSPGTTSLSLFLELFKLCESSVEVKLRTARNDHPVNLVVEYLCLNGHGWEICGKSGGKTICMSLAEIHSVQS